MCAETDREWTVDEEFGRWTSTGRPGTERVLEMTADRLRSICVDASLLNITQSHRRKAMNNSQNKQRQQDLKDEKC